MTCKECNAKNVETAVYCAECGTGFYRASQWSESYQFYDPQDAGSITVPLYIENDGKRVLYPKQLRGRNGQFVKWLTERGGVDRDAWWDVRFEKHEIMEADGRFSGLTLECELGHDADDAFPLPVPDLRFGMRPIVQLQVGDSLRLNANSTVVEAPFIGPDLPDGVIPLSLVSSREYALEGRLIVENDAESRVQSVIIATDDGREVVNRSYDTDDSRDAENASFTIPLPPDRHEELGEPAHYDVRVGALGIRAPIEFRFAPEYKRAPDMQVFVERPTADGIAFVGVHAMRNDDVSRDQLSRTTNRLPFSDDRINALQSDALVTRTLSDLEDADAPRIRWHIPKNTPRVKRVAIDQIESDALHDTGLEYQVRVSVGDESLTEGPFDVNDRGIVSINIPELDADANGRLTVWMRSVGIVLDIKLDVRVFDPEKFPFPIAVDFGTTNSCVALSLPDEASRRSPIEVRPETTRLVPVGRMQADNSVSNDAHPLLDSDVIPTRLISRGGDALDLDPDVFERESNADDRTHSMFKLHLEEPEPQPPTPQHLTEVYLTELLRRTCTYLEERGIAWCIPQSLICSLPTAFSEHSREAILDAYESAQAAVGVSGGRRRTIDESMAAFQFARVTGLPKTMSEQTTGLESTLNAFRTEGALILVYDFGGGTTDVTAFYATWSGGQDTSGRWSYVELTAGGDPDLGGERVTTWMQNELFDATETPRTWRPVAERIKRSLHEDTVRINAPHETSAMGVSTGDEAREKVREVEASIRERLEKRTSHILKDILDKTHQRITAHTSTSKPIPIITMLAGNASRLHEFDNIIRTNLNAVLDGLGGGPSYRVASVSLIDEPKAAVAKGAYLVRGFESGVDKPYYPHVSYWIQLPPDVYPAEGRHRVASVRGTRYVEIVAEGSERPFRAQLAPTVFGLQDGGVIQVFQHRGVGFSPLPDTYDFDGSLRDNALLVEVSETEHVTLTVCTPSRT